MWYQLQIETCRHDEVETLSEALDVSGALSISMTDKNDDPVLEPAPGTTPLWPEVIITALYTEEDGAKQAMAQLAPLFPHLHFSLSCLPDEDWERAWMDNFKPQQFGQKLWVCPSWITPPEPQAVNLILDPGLAFGTGTHPTTALCLNWLGNASLDNLSVIDYGCGSGILALAALKLGAKDVQAVDIDEQALLATRNNALTNALLCEQLRIDFPDALTAGVDVLIANILLSPLLTLQDRFKSLLNPGGTLLISGILSEQVATLIKAYESDFIHQHTYQQEGWAMLTFVRT